MVPPGEVLQGGHVKEFYFILMGSCQRLLSRWRDITRLSFRKDSSGFCVQSGFEESGKGGGKCRVYCSSQGRR